MALIETKNGRTILKKAESMMLVPYVYNNSLSDYVIGNDIYDISAIIGDSIVIEQSEGETATKYNEFKASPLLECVSGGKYVFTTQCLDLQNKILKSVFGAMTVSGVEGAAAFTDDFATLYALIRIRFSDESLPDVILPKVKMNSRLFINQLKTRSSQGNIAGTSLTHTVCIKDKNNNGHLLQFSSPNTYMPSSPVVFVPKSYSVMFSKTNNSSTVYEVDFENGNKTQLYIDPSNGTWSSSPP